MGHGRTLSAGCRCRRRHLIGHRHQCKLLLLRLHGAGLRGRWARLESILLLALLLAPGVVASSSSAACRLVQLQAQVGHVLTPVVVVHGRELARAAAMR